MQGVADTLSKVHAQQNPETQKQNMATNKVHKPPIWPIFCLNCITCLITLAKDGPQKRPKTSPT